MDPSRVDERMADWEPFPSTSRQISLPRDPQYSKMPLAAFPVPDVKSSVMKLKVLRAGSTHEARNFMMDLWSRVLRRRTSEWRRFRDSGELNISLISKMNQEKSYGDFVPVRNVRMDPFQLSEGGMIKKVGHSRKKLKF
ncbi:response regulator 1 [Striga asiatica]|uniref:Response regulator 1 n=1 Tax=Striga asiatica TaxID=4170 RepID=A0A5A7RDN4_STRAF|nr:response regulator 1 [Striga asiatica]